METEKKRYATGLILPDHMKHPVGSKIVSRGGIILFEDEREDEHRANCNCGDERCGANL
jgi:hypothetical protein